MTAPAARRASPALQGFAANERKQTPTGPGLGSAEGQVLKTSAFQNLGCGFAAEQGALASVCVRSRPNFSAPDGALSLRF
jgi:hypothetical protein